MGDYVAWETLWFLRPPPPPKDPRAIWILEDGYSADGTGPGTTIGYTADRRVALKHWKKIKSNPYSTGRVLEVLPCKEEGTRIAELEAELEQAKEDRDAVSRTADQAIEELARLQEANRWIPVEERMPEPTAGMRKYLLLCEDGEVTIGWPDKSQSDSWGTYDLHARIVGWRPLPEGPGA